MNPKVRAWRAANRANMIARLLIALVRVYQRTLSIVLRGAFGPICRFEPSCSRYAVACLEGHGALRGSLLSFKRLCRCSPFHPGGFDPPPPPDPRRAARLGLPANAPPTEAAPPVAEAAPMPAAASTAPDSGVAEPSSKVKSAAAAS